MNGSVPVDGAVYARSNEQEIQDELKGGTTVFVCGPASMSDEVRMVVSDMAKKGAVVRFSEDRFGW